MQDYLVAQLESNATLSAYMDDARISTDPWLHSAHSLGIGPGPALPERPFIIWNELPVVPYRALRKASNVQARTFQWYVHDDRGDFGRINEIFPILEEIIVSMAPFHLMDGTRCSDSEWLGISGNLPDPEYDLIMRIGSARFTVSTIRREAG